MQFNWRNGNTFYCQYISRRTLYLIYCIFGAGCAVLMIFLKETNGQPIPDQIDKGTRSERERRMRYSSGCCLKSIILL